MPSGSEDLVRSTTADAIPPHAFSSSSTDATNEAAECPICLDEAARPRKLHCGHVFCHACIRRHATVSSERATGPAPCPCCKVALTADDYQHLQLRAPSTEGGPRGADGRTDGRTEGGPRGADRGYRAAGELELTGLGGSDWARRTRDRQARGQRHRWVSEARSQTDEDLRGLRQATRGLELRLCPRCSAPISKNGGCNRVTCPCGHAFNWPTARPVRPCRSAHGRVGTWGETCAFCSREAHAKLAVRRTVSVAIAVPVVAGAVATVGGLAAAVVAVPLATFGPLALAYEPVRRLRKKKHNPFAVPAASGLLAVGAVCSGYDSD